MADPMLRGLSMRRGGLNILLVFFADTAFLASEDAGDVAAVADDHEGGEEGGDSQEGGKIGDILVFKDD